MSQKVREVVCQAIGTSQMASGFSSSGINDGTRPMRDLQGFDSLMAAETTLDISVNLGCDIRENHYLFQTQNYEARSIDEIVDCIVEIMNEQGVALP